MAHHKSLGIRLLKAGLAGLIFVIVGVGGFLLVSEGIPRALTRWVEGSLRQRNIEPNPVVVEHVGLSRTDLAAGTVGTRGQSLTWRSLEVHYSPIDVLAGQFEKVHFQQPQLDLRWPLTMEPGMPVPPTAVESPGVPESVAAADTDPADDTQVRESVEEESKLPTQQPDPATPAVYSNLATFLPSYDELIQTFKTIPFDRFLAESGQVSLELFDRAEISGEWEALLSSDPEELTGRVFLESGLLSMSSTLSGIESAKAVSLHSEVSLEPAFFKQLKEWIPGIDNLPDVTSSLTGEVLLDWVGSGHPSISAEARLAALHWAPLEGMKLEASSLMAIGTVKDSTVRVNAGGRIKRFDWNTLSVSPFGVRGSYTTGERIRFESERFNLTSRGWSGLFAFRGSAPFPDDAGLPIRGQLELAFSGIDGPSFTVEPASLFIRYRETVTVQASPIGLKRRMTLWIEDFVLETNPELTGYSGSFIWYNPAGAHMGSFKFTDEGRFDADPSPQFRLEDASGHPFMVGSVEMGGEEINVDAEGELPVPWLNALNDWGGWLPVQLQGASPKIDVSLRNLRTFPRGKAVLLFAGSDILLDKGLSINGLNGAIPLHFLGFPATRSEQHWSIDEITTGTFRITDIRFNWSLPTLRTLRVDQLSGQLGEGTIRFDPFLVDPLDPEIRTTVNISQVEAGLLLDWYGESRFAIEGALSGELDLQWREGTWIVGTGGMRIDNSYTEARFVFTDEDFLRDQFSSLQAVPDELREPLLSALLRKGIQIDQLELALVPALDPEKVSLKLSLAGKTVSDEIEVPIDGLVINNLIPREDLADLLGLLGPVRFLEAGEGD